MDPSFRFYLLIFLPLSSFFLSCKNNTVENPEQFETVNTYDLTVSAIQHDEFQRVVPFTGTASLTLTTLDRVLQGTITDGDTSFTFYRVPLQQCILRAEKDGFYPYENGEAPSPAKFYPLPTPEMRIDTIQIVGEHQYFDYYEIRIRCVTHQETPKDGVMNCIFFFGLDSTVSQQPGTYFTASGGYAAESNEFLGYFDKTLGEFPAGTIVYVTARLCTGATEDFYDNSTRSNFFTNLEENSKVITSFTY